MVFCQYCGEQQPNGSNYCTLCGARLTKPSILEKGTISPLSVNRSNHSEVTNAAPRGSDRGEPIHTEWIPPMILKSSMKSYRGVIANLMFIRCMFIFFVGGLVYLYFIYDHQQPPPYRLVIDVLLLIGTALIPLVSEYAMRYYREASYPVKIYTNGIQLYTYQCQRIRGDDGFIKKDDIFKFKIIRGNGYFYSPTPKALDRYRRAPVEMLIYLKNGKQKRIRYRFPPEVLKMRDILRSDWGAVVEDESEGLGTVETIKVNWFGPTKSASDRR